MDQYDDLLAVALQAVNAVEAKSEVADKRADFEGSEAESRTTFDALEGRGEDACRVAALEVEKSALCRDLERERAARAQLEHQLELSKERVCALETSLDEEKKARATAENSARVSAERVVRVNSDFENYRKRVARDQERMQQQAAEKIVMSFLPVMDNLERALSHSTMCEDGTQLLQGLKMTGKSFLATLAKLGCMQFKSVGETFNPAFHDVLQRVEDASVAHNSVVQEHLSGYLMNNRVLRPALVVVAQHPEGEASCDASDREAEATSAVENLGADGNSSVSSDVENVELQCENEEGDR